MKYGQIMEMYAQDWNTQASTSIRLHKKNAKLHLKQTPLHILKLHQLKKREQFAFHLFYCLVLNAEWAEIYHVFFLISAHPMISRRSSDFHDSHAMLCDSHVLQTCWSISPVCSWTIQTIIEHHVTAKNDDTWKDKCNCLNGCRKNKTW